MLKSFHFFQKTADRRYSHFGALLGPAGGHILAAYELFLQGIPEVDGVSYYHGPSIIPYESCVILVSAMDEIRCTSQKLTSVYLNSLVERMFNSLHDNFLQIQGGPRMSKDDAQSTKDALRRLISHAGECIKDINEIKAPEIWPVVVPQQKKRKRAVEDAGGSNG